MKHYSKELKDSIIARLLPPINAKAADLHKETGIPEGTMASWLHEVRKSNHQKSPAKVFNQCGADIKLAVIIETASLNETELAEYCRARGVYPEEIAKWKASFIKDASTQPNRVDHDLLLQEQKKNQQLQKELNRKEKALAEVAALLVLQKKFQALMATSEDS